ncbi:MAG: hypothetical protein WAM39_05390, partial [Bryobacteraceae bacterium]
LAGGLDCSKAVSTSSASAPEAERNPTQQDFHYLRCALGPLRLDGARGSVSTVEAIGIRRPPL